jgi:hypothetical protein
MYFLTALRVQSSTQRRMKEGKVSEERAQHPQEPAEGSDEDVEASGAERAGETAEATEEGPLPSQHPEEPAEGSEEDVNAAGADRAGGDGG